MGSFFFNLKQLDNRSSLDDIEFDENTEGDKPVAFSEQLGTPVISNLVFLAGEYTVGQQKTTYEEVVLNTVLINVSQSKNIVTTAVAGRSGTVKEYTSDGDYVINIKGYIVNEEDDDSYPEEKVRALNEVLKAPISVEFTSEFLQKINSFNLTITDYSLPQEAGFRNRQAFDINAISDKPIELQLNEEEQLKNG